MPEMATQMEFGTVTKKCSMCPRYFVPDSVRQQLCGHCLKEHGMEAASMNQARKAMLKEMRGEAVWAAQQTRLGEVTIEDVYSRVSMKLGMSIRAVTEILGPAAGSVFKGQRWKFTGRRVLATLNRKNHARELKVWRLKHGHVCVGYDIG